MKRVKTFHRAGSFAFVCALTVSACSGQDFDARVRVEGIDTPTPSAQQARDTSVSQIYTLAAQKNEALLIGLRTAAIRSGATPDPATALALFTLNPDKYQRMFVEDFPEDFSGVSEDFGRRFAQAKLERDGANYPVDRLADIAAAGDSTAERKLLEGLAFSAGSPLEHEYVAQVERIAQTEPAATLAAFAHVPMTARLAAESETDWCTHPPNALLNAQPPAMANAAALAAELRAGIDTHCRLLAQAHDATPEPRRRKVKRSAHQHAKAAKNAHDKK